MQPNIQKQLRITLVTSTIAILCFVISILLQSSINPYKSPDFSAIGCYISCIVGFIFTVISLFSPPRFRTLTRKQRLCIIVPFISTFFALINGSLIIDTSISLLIILLITIIALARLFSNTPSNPTPRQKVSANTDIQDQNEFKSVKCTHNILGITGIISLFFPFALLVILGVALIIFILSILTFRKSRLMNPIMQRKVRIFTLLDIVYSLVMIPCGFFMVFAVAFNVQGERLSSDFQFNITYTIVTIINLILFFLPYFLTRKSRFPSTPPQK